MDYHVFFQHWLLLPQVWLIMGMLIALLELGEGSQVFFLPVGLGAVLNSGLLYVQQEAIFALPFLPETWYGMLIVWAVGSVLFSLLLLLFKRGRQQDVTDVNQY